MDASANTASEPMKTLRRPSRSPLRPPSSRRAPNVNAYPLTTQAMPLMLKPRPLWIDGNFVSARTVMAGRFDKEFAYTPIGTVQPNGQHVQWELINIFRYTDDGRLVEEWVQTTSCGN